ncbi:pyridoxamine 5'-phosphate oxidase family protein [Nocardioides sp. zg-ZUI104]|uniref:pyridoxamine 5'-phosphate oxidase family protein n=1 Tax=Nocardioides faecalis TaxID=2803858 RepID=UPI001BD1326D|nr:pyridoxamine 5'-phosphate oxidase family protein [Nocardioides faecalis]MBS4751751.1 pyridoxamine 5'-phosphate oxidase family protein [Nocardioides faecalis]
MRSQDWSEITDEAALTALLGEPTPAALAKERSALTAIDRDWLAASPFCVIGTADAEGRCDVSPKGDPAGSLVHVLDEHTIAIAERPGNRRADSYRNVLANPHVGLEFLIPGRGDTLRVNGRARLVSDAPFFDDLEVKGHRPVLALVVDVETVFFHCAKAFLRAGLWKPETWAPEAVVPRRAVVAQRMERADTPLDQLDEYYGPRYEENLYVQP